MIGEIGRWAPGGTTTRAIREWAVELLLRQGEKFFLLRPFSVAPPTSLYPYSVYSQATLRSEARNMVAGGELRMGCSAANLCRRPNPPPGGTNAPFSPPSLLLSPLGRCRVQLSRLGELAYRWALLLAETRGR